MNDNYEEDLDNTIDEFDDEKNLNNDIERFDDSDYLIYDKKKVNEEDLKNLIKYDDMKKVPKCINDLLDIKKTISIKDRVIIVAVLDIEEIMTEKYWSDKFKPIKEHILGDDVISDVIDDGSKIVGNFFEKTVKISCKYFISMLQNRYNKKYRY